MSVVDDLSAVLSSTTLQQLSKALTIGAQINFKDALSAFQSANVLGEIETLDDVMKLIGVFFPPVAIAANDVSAAVEGYEILLKLKALGPGKLSDNAGEQQSQIVQDRFGR